MHPLVLKNFVWTALTGPQFSSDCAGDGPSHANPYGPLDASDDEDAASTNPTEPHLKFRCLQPHSKDMVFGTQQELDEHNRLFHSLEHPQASHKSGTAQRNKRCASSTQKTNHSTPHSLRSLSIAGEGPRQTNPLDNSSQASSQFFDAESILSHRRHHATLQFLVRWQGYTSSDDTWECLRNVRNCIAFRDYVRNIPELAHLLPSNNHSTQSSTSSTPRSASPTPIRSTDTQTPVRSTAPRASTPAPRTPARMSFLNTAEVQEPAENIFPEAEDQKLLDIPLHEYGHLLLQVQTERFCPESLLARVRAAFNTTMQHVVDHPENHSNWKKLLLLPLVLFSPTDTLINSSQRKKDLIKRLDLIYNNTWDSLSTQSFRLRKLPSVNNVTAEQKEKAKTHRINKLAEANNFSRLYNFVTTERVYIPPSQATVAALRAKHPPRGPYVIPADVLHSMHNHHSVDSIQAVLGISGEMLRSCIHKKKDFISPGTDNMRWEHYRQLIGRGGIERPEEERFATLLAQIVVLLLDTREVPAEVYDALRDNSLVAIPKSNGDVRPIGMGVTLRKLCSIEFLRYTHQITPGNASFNKTHFRKLQYGLDDKGTETIIHGVRYTTEAHPEHDVFLLDADNAFNRVSRLKGLEETFKKFPFIIPFLRKIYLTDSTGWFFGLNSGLERVISQEGFHQGDVLSSWLFCMTLQPLLQATSEIIGDDGFLKFFIDDGNIACPHDRMLLALDYLTTHGPSIGYIIKPTKGKYLLGRCESPEIALSRKQHLIDSYGFDPNIICIHPDNGGIPSDYGAVVLGGFCGSDTFVSTALNDKLTQLTAEANALKTVQNNQIKYLLLRKCFAQKITHLQRTLPPPLMAAFLDSFNTLKREILESITDSPLSDKTWTLAELPLSDAGLGLGDVFTTGTGAFAASFAEAIGNLTATTPTFFIPVNNIPSTQAFAECSAKLAAKDPTLTADNILHIAKGDRKGHLQNRLNSVFRKPNADQVRTQHTDPRENLWIRSGSDNSDGSLWLDTGPKDKLHAMDSETFKKAVRLRLFQPMNSTLQGLKCPCSTQHGGKTVDKEGLHWITGCKLCGVRQATHDAIADITSVILRNCGVHTSREEHGNFGPNNLRSDITARNFPRATTAVALDIRITSTVPANTAELTGNLADINRALKASYQEKMTKYSELAKANGVEFKPVVFDINGRMHPESRKVYETCLQEAARTRNIPFPALWHYWMSSLQVALQRNIVRGMERLTMHTLHRGGIGRHFVAPDHIISRSTMHIDY
jgi:hypothetical protein